MRRGIDCIPLGEGDAKNLLCYPRVIEPYCSRLLRALREAGVEEACSYGPHRLPSGYSILGSGWAGNVVALVWRGKLVAGKLLKPGSRRPSMLREALLAVVAGLYGIGPEVYQMSRWFILMRLIDGPRLGEYKASEPWRLWLVLRRLIYKAYLLDRLGIDHGELVRPEGQVLVEKDEPYIIDYDSASIERKPRNLTRLLTGLWRLGLIKRSPLELRDLLRSYRYKPSLELLNSILKALHL